MGLRGALPKQQLRSNAIKDTKPPSWLSPDGCSFWEKHLPQLVENKILTAETADSFAILCDSWARLQAFHGQPTSRAYLDMQKAFVSLAKLFRLMPTEKPNIKEDRFTDMNEIPLDLED